jgi:glucose/arabinose dehydrogenase
VPPPEPTIPPAVPATSISLNLVANGFFKPTYLTHAGDERLFVMDQVGRIYIIQEGELLPVPFLDIQNRVNSNALEQGLLGLAFHPQYVENGTFFVNYSAGTGDTVIARYQVSADPNVADPNSEMILMTYDQPYENHNGGQLAFGPDGYLYIGVGDGGSADDPLGHGQNSQTVLGTLLRLDVDHEGNGTAYAIPAGNPFQTQPEFRPEVWAMGLRNPWRFSFDRLTGDLFIADVGQNLYEEVHYSAAADGGGQGANYGWNIMEGQHCFLTEGCDQTGLEIPITEYDHSQGCSITGGYIYRGSRYPQLTGNYFFADYCLGTVWSLVQLPDGSWARNMVLQSGLVISSFGEDVHGELYVLDHQGGGVYEVQP